MRQKEAINETDLEQALSRCTGIFMACKCSDCILLLCDKVQFGSYQNQTHYNMNAPFYSDSKQSRHLMVLT